MNIDDVVRRGRPDSAGWASSAEGRRVLDGVITADPAADPPGRPLGRPRPALRWSVLGTGLAGAVAAGVFAVSVISAPPDGPRAPADGTVGASNGTAGPVTPVAARDILLAAATRAAQEPTESGRYWHVKTLDVVGPMRLGCPPGNAPCTDVGYWMMRHGVTESWDAADPREASWTGRLELGVRPYSPADEQAWRAAGAPAEWTLDTDGLSKRVVTTRPGESTLTQDAQAPRYLEDLGLLTLQEVRDLPDEPGALRARVVRGIKTEMAAAPGSATSNFLLFGFLGRMLLDTPAPPKVRAAAFRILADLSGVRSLGTVKDESGRSGQGVEIRYADNTQRLIVDPATHRLLGSSTDSSRPGDKFPGKQSSTLVLAAEWSDAAPQPPTPPRK